MIHWTRIKHRPKKILYDLHRHIRWSHATTHHSYWKIPGASAILFQLEQCEYILWGSQQNNSITCGHNNHLSSSSADEEDCDEDGQRQSPAE